MENNNKKFEQEAKAFFADKKNDNVNKLYITSDGCLFRAEHYANNWKNDLKDKGVEIYNRYSLVDTIIDGVKARIEAAQVDQTKSDSVDTEQSSERENLVKEYIGLFDTKPHYKFSDEKVRGLIEAKKAELALTEDADQEGSEGSKNPADVDVQQQESGADQDEADNADQIENK